MASTAPEGRVATANDIEPMASRHKDPIREHGEAPAVAVMDAWSHPRPDAHIIVFANEKGGVGKSTLAFQTAISLANAGHDVLAIDLDRRQQTLERALECRDATARSLKVPLRLPRHLVLDQQSGAILAQEMLRAGNGCDYIIIDAPGRDTRMVRRAISMADTLVTPVNCSFADLDALGRFNPVSMKLKSQAPFAQLVNELREERANRNLPPVDWVVATNRRRGSESRHHAHIDSALEHLSGTIGFRLSDGLSERVAYRELFLFGLTHDDLRMIPDMADARPRKGREIRKFVSGLALATPPIARAKNCGHSRVRSSSQRRENFRSALQKHLGPARV